MFCPQRHYDFIKSCWQENPYKRPSFTQTKEHVYKDPVFPKEFVAHDRNDNKLSVPTTYEFMRKQYNTIQRSNPVYLSMAWKGGDSDSNKSKDTTGTISEDTSEEDNLLQIICDDDDIIKGIEIDEMNNHNKGLPNITTDLMRFLSEEEKTINV